MGFFDLAYTGTPSWELGGPQPALERLAARGLIVGTVLDLGCGTGANALHLAAHGHPVIGVDLAAGALARARQRAAAARGLRATPRLVTADVRDLAALGVTVDTAIDIGLFHTLEVADHRAYAASVRATLRPGGRCYLLAWSNRNPWGYGPVRVTRAMICRAFADGWQVQAIERERIGTRLAAEGAQAWLATLRAT